jgi:hypothetical protein
MSFRNAAYAVVARIFKLVDSNGFTRVLFGPKVFGIPYPLDGYAFEYNDPDWVGEDAGIMFGDNQPTTDAATRIYAGDAANLYLSVDQVSVFNSGAGGSKGGSASGGTSRLVGSLAAEFTATAQEDNTTAEQLASASLSAVGNGVVAQVLAESDSVDALAQLMALEPMSGATATVGVSVDPTTDQSFANITADFFSYNSFGWQAYSPQVWQGAGTPNIAKINVNYRFFRFGPMMFVRGILSINGAGTLGQIVHVALPDSAAHPPINVGGILGTMAINDASGGLRYIGCGEHAVSAGFHAAVLIRDNTGFNAWGAIPAIALAAGDSIHFELMYEVSG